MAAYVVANYRITNPESFEAYPPAAIETLMANGAEVVVADFESEVADGQAGHVTVVLRFPSKEAVRAWYDSPEYRAIVHLRTDNTEGFLVVADEFVPPA